MWIGVGPHREFFELLATRFKRLWLRENAEVKFDELSLSVRFDREAFKFA